MRAVGSPSSWPSGSGLVKIGRPGASSPNSAASSSSARDGTCWGSSRTSFIVPLLSGFVGPPARSCRSSLCREQRGKKKSAQSARDFSLAGGLGEGGRRGGPGARGKGSGYMMDLWYQPPSPPLCPLRAGSPEVEGECAAGGSWGPTRGRQWRASSCLGRVRAVRVGVAIQAGYANGRPPVKRPLRGSASSCRHRAGQPGSANRGRCSLTAASL